MSERVRVAKSSRIQRWMRRHDWNKGVGLRRRAWSLVYERYPWYDWGHRVMILVGQDDCGNWSEPSPPTWFYRRSGSKRMRRTGYPRTTFEVIRDYEQFRALTDLARVGEGEVSEWDAFCVDQDGVLQLGRRYWGTAHYGTTKSEVRLLRKYLRMWHRLDWWGMRSWLYSQGLHAAVYQRKPFSCQEAPPKGLGGYSHWLCQLKRRHAGPHRFNNYQWDSADLKVRHSFYGVSIPDDLPTPTESKLPPDKFPRAGEPTMNLLESPAGFGGVQPNVDGG